MRDMARYWIEIEPLFGHPSQIDLRSFADAYRILGDLESERARLEQALAIGGVRDDVVQGELVRVRIQIAEKRKAEQSSSVRGGSTGDEQ
jgi:hypothetical protein